MKRNTARLLFAGIFSLLSIFNAPAQIRYRTRYGMALSAEVAGISPFVSANFEFVPIKSATSFAVFRVGAGFKSTSSSQSVSIPLSLTYNFAINKSKNYCETAPQTLFKENFLETGVGMSYVSSLGQQPQYLFTPILGIRKQFIRWGKAEVLFFKIHLTPIFTDGSFRFGAGLGLGRSL